MQAARERALAELVFGPPLDASDPGAVRSWLARHGVGDVDARAIEAQGLEHLLVYRSLVRGTLVEALQRTMPRAVTRLGPRFAEYFDQFCAERGPRTHFLRDLPAEFLEFCEPLWKSDGKDPACLLDVARYEILHLQVAAAPESPPARVNGAGLDLDGGLVFAASVRLAHYDHPVHELHESREDDTPLIPRPTDLFVYRDTDHRARYLELSPLAAGIIRRLLEGCSLRESLLRATAERRRALDEEVLSDAARLLSDLSERGAVLGPTSAAHGCVPDSHRP